MFARFAGIGVGHLTLNVGGQIPALMVEADNNMDEEEDQYVTKHEGVG